MIEYEDAAILTLEAGAEEQKKIAESILKEYEKL